MFVRTCQECGNRIEAVPPDRELTNAFLNKKCKECGSTAYDYGSHSFTKTAEGKFVKIEWGDEPE